ncbi:MAG TPA: hypothetical protein VL330_06465, partial [Actinomycetes bacterium]|nr:hypothetical protein [Actinomycetes bacterium]
MTADELLERVELSGLGPRDETSIGARDHTRQVLVALPAWNLEGRKVAQVFMELVRRRCGGTPPD